jgi:hypothetical protein
MIDGVFRLRLALPDVDQYNDSFNFSLNFARPLFLSPRPYP